MSLNCATCAYFKRDNDQYPTPQKDARDEGWCRRNPPVSTGSAGFPATIGANGCVDYSSLNFGKTYVPVVRVIPAVSKMALRLDIEPNNIPQMIWRMVDDTLLVCYVVAMDSPYIREGDEISECSVVAMSLENGEGYVWKNILECKNDLAMLTHGRIDLPYLKNRRATSKYVSTDYEYNIAKCVLKGVRTAAEEKRESAGVNLNIHYHSGKKGYPVARNIKYNRKVSLT